MAGEVLTVTFLFLSTMCGVLVVQEGYTGVWPCALKALLALCFGTLVLS